MNKYYQNERKEMLRFVPKAAETVLDIGCGEGVFGAILKDRLGAKVVGIELNPKAAKVAEGVLDQVLVGDAILSLSEMSQKFDVIICNDLIEHIANHEELLKEIQDHLSETGVLVASIPNVRFIKNLWHVLVKKDWEYQSEGIRDATHLRFFTKKSLEKLFARLGFEIVLIEGINGFQDSKFRWLNWASLGYLKDTQHLQFAVVAKKYSK